MGTSSSGSWTLFGAVFDPRCQPGSVGCREGVPCCSVRQETSDLELGNSSGNELLSLFKRILHFKDVWAETLYRCHPVTQSPK